MTVKIRWILPAVAGVLSACGATGAWQGAGAEKMYDQALEAQRATAVLNNDDYYELHQDGRIYVIADAGDLREFLANGELPLRLTRIGGGPKGETIVFGIARPESKKKEGFGAVEMYDGKREGAAKDFYAEVYRDSRWVVFGSWKDLQAFRQSGAANPAASATTADGKPVTFTTDNPDVMARFKKLHG